MDVVRYIGAKAKLVDAFLDARLPEAAGRPDRLYEAIRYSVFSGGKRFRPALALAVCEAFGGDTAAALPPAGALELIHVSSLIHDDLPCMDDADIRRGHPSCHRAFSEAIAVLVGDWLLSYPFELLSVAAAEGLVSGEQALMLVNELAGAICTSGIVEGQAEDLAAEEREIDFDELRLLHAHKTGSLIKASVRSGLIAAGVAEGDLEEMGAFAQPLGLAFQIADDILDVTGETAVLGKPVGADDSRKKNTYVSFFGLERAVQLAGETAAEAHAKLDSMPDSVDVAVLHSMVDFVVDRRK